MRGERYSTEGERVTGDVEFEWGAGGGEEAGGEFWGDPGGIIDTRSSLTFDLVEVEGAEGTLGDFAEGRAAGEFGEFLGFGTI